jgi:hypothetical protein
MEHFPIFTMLLMFRGRLFCMNPWDKPGGLSNLKLYLFCSTMLPLVWIHFCSHVYITSRRSSLGGKLGCNRVDINKLQQIETPWSFHWTVGLIWGTTPEVIRGFGERGRVGVPKTQPTHTHTHTMKCSTLIYKKSATRYAYPLVCWSTNMTIQLFS